jgi:hypothetical protein
MNPAIARMRSRIDELNKQIARRPRFATGGDMRSTEEALNTSAQARGMASTRYPKAKLNRK